ncbi:MAG TPA: adenylosuccinate lyase family protein, partial [Brevibacterium sp.]|nr:adenylosuccinate lyase family protein [Brevibacterium sp.]
MPAGGLFGALEGDPEVDRHVDDVAVLSALVEAEVALVRAAARVGLVPGEAASAVDDAAQRLVVDIEELARRSVSGGNPVIPLVQELSAIVPESARPWVHIGATSQDILDTALMLIARRATGRI